jgi:WD40 repeat protein
VPLRIHRAAGEWARAEAAERLAANAGRAPDDRSELRATQAAIASGVVELQAASERRRLYAAEEPFDPSEPQVCPFRGLAPFDAAHAEYFFGRERLIAELVARLVGSTLLAVFGPSGSGKSSAVRAGLLPALAEGVVPGSEHWRRAVMRPGEHPLAELTRTLARAVPEAGPGEAAPPIGEALDRLPAGERLVLCVDQFEEAFVGCRDENEREAFFDALAEGATDPDERLIAVLAIRADFYGRCAKHAELSTLISANQVLVGPMRRDELRRAIELPARRAGLRTEPRLVSALVGDTAGEPGGLPLLSAALVELWQRREGRTLRHEVYEQTGGVEGAVARLAEDAYQRLSAAERSRARSLLLRLAGDDEAAEAFVRRRVALDELELERDPDAARALTVLTEARLLTVDEGAVEVAHEALLREWPRLRDWLVEDAEGRRLHQHLIAASREWRDSGHDPAELYRGARLAAALGWAAEHDPELNDLERTFLDASKKASESEGARQRRTNRRLRTLLAGVGVLLAIAVIAGVIAFSERQGARSAATAEAAQRLGAQALTEDRLDRALMLANAGLALDDSLATRSSLLSVLVRGPATLGTINGDGPLFALALSPDGRTLATGGVEDTVFLFDSQTLERIGDYQVPGVVIWLSFHPRDGSLAVVGGISAPNARGKGYLHVLDAATQRPRRKVALRGHPADPGLGLYTPFGTYAPDERSVIVAYMGCCERPGTSVPMFLDRFDLRTGSPSGPAVRVAPRSSPGNSGPRSAHGGPLLVASDEATYSIDADTLRVVRRYPVGAFSAGISPDGATLALGGADGRVRLLDLASGGVRTLTGRHDAEVSSEAFSPDGRRLATGGEDGTVIVWDLREGRAIETLEGHNQRVFAQAFDPDGDILYTASGDSSVRVWDVAGYRRLGRPFRTSTVDGTPESFAPAFALSPDGRTLALARPDGRVDLIDAKTLRRTGGFEAFARRSALAIEYSPDGRRLAVAGGGGGVGLWDAGSGQRVGRLLRAPVGPEENNPHDVKALAFGRGGLLAAAGAGGFGARGAVRIWELDGRKLIGRPRHLPPLVRGLAFSPDGSQLAIAFGARGALFATGRGDPDGVEVRDVHSDETLARLPADEVGSVAFSPDGRLLAGGRLGGNVLLWETDSWGRLGAPLASRGGQLPSVAFSPDGRTLATAHDDGTVVLWEVGSQRPIGPPLPGLPDAPAAARFTPDGDRLFALSATRHAIRWEVDPEVWVKRACAVAGGGLTPEQWAEAVPEQNYVSVCPSG